MKTTENGITRVPARPMLFLHGMTFGLAGIILAVHIFNGPLIGAFCVLLSSIGLVETMQHLYARHRDLSWSSNSSPESASNDLMGNIVALHLGVFVAFVLFAMQLPAAQVERLFSFQLLGIFLQQATPGPFVAQFLLAARSGLVVLLVAMLLAAIYREGGIAVTGSWIASVWGIGLLSVVWNSGQGIGTLEFATNLVVMITSSIGFFTGSSAALFLTRGAMKYGFSSPSFRSILKSSMALVGAAVGFVLFSAATTAYMVSSTL